MFGAGVAAEVLGLLADQQRGTREGPFPTLTGRELEVLQLIAAGRSNTEIARTLVVSDKTARNQVSNIFAKSSASPTAPRPSSGHDRRGWAEPPQSPRRKPSAGEVQQWSQAALALRAAQVTPL